jgi:hypothetical protein
MLSLGRSVKNAERGREDQVKKMATKRRKRNPIIQDFASPTLSGSGNCARSSHAQISILIFQAFNSADLSQRLPDSSETELSSPLVETMYSAFRILRPQQI